MPTLPFPIRVAVIGCGGIAGAHMSAYAKLTDRFRVTALCDIDAEKLNKRTAQLPSPPPHFTDWREMFSQASDSIDAVDICLPHHLHAPAIIDSAKAGKHVLCEKPMCIDVKQADAIAQAVSAAGITYMSAHNQLFMPAVREAKKRIDAGELGRVMVIRSQDCFVANSTRPQWRWRADLHTQGGGELIDTGYHPTYRLLHLAGSSPAAIRATFARFKQDIDGEDTASVQVRFENGTIGEILTSWAFANPFGTHQIHIIGSEGQLYGSENTLYHLPIDAKEPTRQDFEPVETFQAEIEHFGDCLHTGTPPIHGVKEGRAVLDVLLAAAESAEGWR